MTKFPLIKSGLIPAAVVFCSILLAGVAKADTMFFQISNSTGQTLINCCLILALGMVISALILKKWK